MSARTEVLEGKNSSLTLPQYQEAYRAMRHHEAMIGFEINLAAYLVVNTALIVLNLVIVPAFYWFVFPLVGWGIGTAMHYTFGVRKLDRSLSEEQAKVERLAGKGPLR